MDKFKEKIYCRFFQAPLQERGGVFYFDMSLIDHAMVADKIMPTF